MLSTKLLCLAGALLLLPGSQPREVRIEFREGQVYEMHLELTSESVYEGLMVVEGQEYELEEAFLSSLGDEQEVKLSQRDEVLEHDGEGRVTRVAREYTRLEQRSVEEGEEVERTGLLVGEPLEGSLNGEGELELAVLDDEREVDQKFLVHHSLHEFFMPLLPPEAVEPGDSWELDEEAALDFSLTHDPLYFELPPDLEPDPAFVEQLRDAARCEVEVTLEGEVERDDADCLLLSYLCTIECELDQLPESEEDESSAEEGEMTEELTTSMRFTGSLWIDAGARFPVAMEVELEGRDTADIEWTEEGTPLRMELVGETEGRIEVEWELLERGR